jgi:M6 family metalloprotease-like protein
MLWDYGDGQSGVLLLATDRRIIGHTGAPIHRPEESGMWWSLSSAEGGFGAAAVGDQCVVSEPATGRLLLVAPAGGPAPASVVGEGWLAPRAVAAMPDGTVLVADGNDSIWRVDLGAAVPAQAALVANRLGALGQVTTVRSGQAVYAIAGRRRSVRPWPGRPVPDPQLDPWPAGRTRLVRIDATGGAAATVSRNLAGGAGLAITGDEATCFITERGSGSVVAVDLATRDRSVAVTGLDRPSGCTWLDEGAGLLVVVEEGSGALVVIDVSSGTLRRVPGCPGSPGMPALVGDTLVIAAGSVVAAVAASAVRPDRVVLAPPAEPIYRGGYARVPVDLGSTGILFDDLEFTIVEGTEYAAVSPSRDETFDAARPHTMLLAGPHAGAFTLEARDGAGGIVAQAPFAVTDEWTELDGPPMAFTGANLLYASGGAWGSLFNGIWPFSFTYGPQAVSGTRRVALVFVNTSDATLPAGTAALYRDSLINGVTGADGVARSVRAFYREISYGQLDIAAAGESTVTLPKAWSEYTKQFSATDARFVTRNELIADAMWRAQDDIDFRAVDIAVFVVASPNGGQPTMSDPTRRFTWPIASGGTYLLTKPAPPFALLYWWWKSLPWSVMPAEWEALDPRRVFQTLSHELGHTIGMADLYNDARDIGSWDIMSNESQLPALSLPHRHVLGWIDQAWLRRYNFLVENPVDEQLTLRAAELLGGGPPAGERAGLVVEVATGWRYYFEYRSRQNVVPGVDPGPTQVADQGLPLDRRVLGTDVLAGSYSPPVVRKPIRLLGDDGDREGVALSPGQDYEELDATGNATFRLDVLSADDDTARVRVRYQPVPAPQPPWPQGPDPSIRPWPGGGDWQSPDIRITNALNMGNAPWAEHDNTIIATVRNEGSATAAGVRVGFWVKDFTVSSAGPETFLGWATGDIGAGATRDFSVSWVPPARPSFFGLFALVHFCIVVRIAPQAGGEVNPSNNVAQSNYTIMWTLAGSPFSRQRLPVRVANPYPDRPVDVSLHAEQQLDWYRTYLEHTSVRLGPGESRNVEVMVECVADEPAFRDAVPRERLFRVPNIVTTIAAVREPESDVTEPIGGATIEVRAARAAELTQLDVSRRNASGRVRLVDDGSAAPRGGEVVVATRANAPGGEASHRTALGLDGAFAVDTPDFARVSGPLDIDLVYAGDEGIGPATARVTVT